MSAQISSGTIGVVLSGGNIAWTTFRSLVGRAGGCGGTCGVPGLHGSAQRTLHDGIGLFTQYVSAERIAAIAYEGAEAADDPLRPGYGR
ncbi:hypothetical protein [Nonomuraea sediminis]|uniref:hypothetical protein n=1 Tax=Nonomuraea sediminis TaxID=2835864 RepID=UPI001BDD4CC0|nr:hypothetical protein [Nonomuraea sediminis]